MKFKVTGSYFGSSLMFNLMFLYVLVLVFFLFYVLDCWEAVSYWTNFCFQNFLCLSPFIYEFVPVSHVTA